MSFRDDAQLDPSEVSDRRGRGGGGRIAVGGGGLGVAGIIVIVLLQLLGGGGGPRPARRAAGSDVRRARGRPRRMPHGRRRERAPGLPHPRLRQLACSASGATSSRAAGATYTPAITYFESGQWQTGCGAGEHASPGRSTARPTGASTSTSASSTSCDDRFGASGGSLAQGYVIAHEYGHHVQDLLGILDRRQQQRGRDRQVGAHASCRPTASPACGRRTRPRRACSSRSPRRRSTTP